MFITINEVSYNIDNIVRYYYRDNNLTMYLVGGESVLIYNPPKKIIQILKSLEYESKENSTKDARKKVRT